jgi:hypothetical protein
MMPICVPKPCHEDWSAMTPHEQGRHCNVCCKTVVDFSSMSDQEVQYFFINKKEEPVCGRFRSEQVQTVNIQLPYNIHTISMPLWKRFLTACLLAFSSMLFSCDTLMGKVDTMGEVTIYGQATDSSETILPAPPPPKYVTGVVMVPVDSSFTSIMAERENNICKDPTWTEDTVQLPASGSNFIPGSSNESTNHDQQTQNTGKPLHKKNPPEADSINCDEREYY